MNSDSTAMPGRSAHWHHHGIMSHALTACSSYIQTNIYHPTTSPPAASAFYFLACASSRGTMPARPCARAWLSGVQLLPPMLRDQQEECFRICGTVGNTNGASSVGDGKLCQQAVRPCNLSTAMNYMQCSAQQASRAVHGLPAPAHRAGCSEWPGQARWHHPC